MQKREILPGTKFGELTVIAELPTDSSIRKFRLKCSCGNVADMWYNNIRSRHIKSCRKCRSNSYEFKGSITYGKDRKKREFTIDKRDFHLISGKVVYVDASHYGEVIVWHRGKKTVLHDLLCIGYDKKKLVVDHIDNDITNNSRSNLRLISKDSSFAKYKKTVRRYFNLIGVTSKIQKKGKWLLTIKNSEILYEGEYDTRGDAGYAERLWLFFNYDIADDSIYVDIPRYAKIDFVQRTGSKKRQHIHKNVDSMLITR